MSQGARDIVFSAGFSEEELRCLATESTAAQRLPAGTVFFPAGTRPDSPLAARSDGALQHADACSMH